jgi:hypothetical protein
MAFDERTIEAVWQKGKAAAGNNPDIWRKDSCGAWMWRTHYGNRASQYGWEIVQNMPADDGGSDALDNLRPLQWQNNASRASKRLKCTVTAKGANNAFAKVGTDERGLRAKAR